MTSRLTLADASFGVHSIWEWVEANGTWVYPSTALVVIGLMAWALLSGFRGERLNAEQRGALKMRIVQLMRHRVSGVSADAVSAELQIDLMLAARLLAELSEEGLVDASASQGSANAPIQYRMKGR